MKYQEICKCCDGVVTAYVHVINQQMADAFYELVEYYMKHGKPTNLQRDLDLTKNQYNNFQKLQYFGLAIRTPNGWFPTELGIEWAYNEAPCFDRVATFGKEILFSTHEAWKTNSKQPKSIFIDDIGNKKYKRREEYQAEKSGQDRLFEAPAVRRQW